MTVNTHALEAPTEQTTVQPPAPTDNIQPAQDSPQEALRKIIEKMGTYLASSPAPGEAKKTNATKARNAIQSIFDNFNDHPDIWVALTASALTAWEEANRQAIGARWTREWSGGRTTETIRDCDACLKPHLNLASQNAPAAQNISTDGSLRAAAATVPSFQLRDDMPMTEQLVRLMQSNSPVFFRQALAQAIASHTTENPFDVNATMNDKKQTLLHVAATHPSGTFIAVLLEQGANPNLPDKKGWSPVQYSAYTGKPLHFDAYQKSNNPILVNWDQKTPDGRDLSALTTMGKEALKDNPAFANSDYDSVIQKLNALNAQPEPRAATEETNQKPLILSGAPATTAPETAVTPEPPKPPRKNS